ncbi:hypothetical protein [Francisella orientalis]|uniref:Uncharacterized protein n=1 Tax=Francisella orientalis TaxID=299583 RepID=A0AAP6X848_9GAMM|nr:hypothetical protein [Francisella orientalis]AFJ43815.1 H2MP_like-1, Putative [NiFe] hydrogenase-specific [Francisella orientalis str. Toba 04]AHB99154.1 hypothetical protein M973_04780 [Francisella orientalis LADL 07-285A]AKN85511.1 hypothetical protein FNO12_0829 [Francisella orientalis FNO12]AKN87050.1 Hypothetical protein FNO24_0829 [Francisella orientalis FNO24]AKN88588.1 Hypothetical protein FNO190_0829 [Francisella orientalis]
MILKKIAIILARAFLGISLLDAVTFEINKTSGNLPSSMVPGVSNNGDISTNNNEDTPSSNDSAPSNPPMTETTTTGGVWGISYSSPRAATGSVLPNGEKGCLTGDNSNLLVAFRGDNQRVTLKTTLSDGNKYDIINEPDSDYVYIQRNGSERLGNQTNPKVVSILESFVSEKGDFIAGVGQGSAMCDNYAKDEDTAGFWNKLCTAP